MSDTNKIQNLTEAETEVMNVVWDKSPTTIREIFEVIKKSRDVAYTTVATTVKILEEKNFLASEKVGKAHTFVPKMERRIYSTAALKNLIDKVFGGVTSGLVRNLLSDSELSESEREEIKKMLEESL